MIVVSIFATASLVLWLLTWRRGGGFVCAAMIVSFIFFILLGCKPVRSDTQEYEIPATDHVVQIEGRPYLLKKEENQDKYSLISLKSGYSKILIDRDYSLTNNIINSKIYGQ